MGPDSGGGTARRRVVIVDNDVITRIGTRAVLEQFAEIEVLGAVDHDTALGWDAAWDDVDVAIVDAADVRANSADQFPGVAVVQAIRRRRRADQVVVVVLTGQALHAGLRRRMWEAGADFFYGRDEGMTEDELAGVVLRPAEHRRMDRTVDELPGELGIGSRTRVNELVTRLGEMNVDDALQPGGAKKSDPHGPRSRWWDRLRERAAGVEGLTPTKANGDAALDQDTPSVPQLRKFWLAMTKVREQPDE